MAIKSYGAEEKRLLAEVIDSGNFADHPGGFIRRFEGAFAKALGSRYAVSGSTAMVLMHVLPGAIGAGAGDEIICDPIVQFHGIAALHGNVVPVWADVRPDNFLMDPADVERKITPRTKAIWVTHLWGFPAEVDKLRQIARRHKLFLLEDCAHAMFLEYKGRYVGNWGDCGTFSFNMGKHLGTGEGGMAICNDEAMHEEIRKRVIFGESPPVLASNYRFNEFAAAVGLVQLKKVPAYLKEYLKGKEHLDGVVEGCDWLQKREPPKGGGVSPYVYACVFRGDGRGFAARALINSLNSLGVRFGLGFTQRPAYLYEFFRVPRAYGDVGCPYNCGHYKGKVDWKPGLCPVAEDILPRLITTSNMTSAKECRAKAEALKKAIAMVEAGQAPHDTYTREQALILDIAESLQPIGPADVQKQLAKKRVKLTLEQVSDLMERLRSGFPRKLSHAGPEKFAYHDLSKV